MVHHSGQTVTAFYTISADGGGSWKPYSGHLYLRAGQYAPKVLNLPQNSATSWRPNVKTHDPMGGHSTLQSYRLESGGGNAYTAAGRAPLPPSRAPSPSGPSGVDAMWILPRTRAPLFLLKDSGPQSHWQVTEVLKALSDPDNILGLTCPRQTSGSSYPFPHPFVDLSDSP